MGRLMAKQPKRLGGPTKDEVATNELDRYVKLLRDYQNVVFAVVVLVLTVGVLAVWQHQRSQEQEDAAWAELGKVSEKDLDKLKDLIVKYEGTTAHPFLVVEYASKLYNRGEKVEDLRQAKEFLERSREEVRGNEVMDSVLKDLHDGIEKELADKKLWPDTAPVGTGSK
jgi:hypothetical protein